jgi:hypothetical protein
LEKQKEAQERSLMPKRTLSIQLYNPSGVNQRKPSINNISHAEILPQPSKLEWCCIILAGNNDRIYHLEDEIDAFHPTPIRIDESTLRLYLKDYKDSLTDWYSLVAIILTLLVTVVAGSFTTFPALGRVLI